MNCAADHSEFRKLAPAGYYLAFRIGFAFPMEETNALPADWVQHYTRNGLFLRDPVVQWIYGNSGFVLWEDLKARDPAGILDQADRFGLSHGVTVCCVDGPNGGQRSYGSFLRSDRPHNAAEIVQITTLFEVAHRMKTPPSNLTNAELEALGLVREGKLIKEIAYDLGVTEGAIKQRLKNAKKKLGARTSVQAVTMASNFGLL